MLGLPDQPCMGRGHWVENVKRMQRVESGERRVE